MRKIVFQAWCQLVDEAVLSRLPGFVRSDSRIRGEPRNLRKYVWQPIDGLWCFVAFRPLDSEAFDAYVGWSVKERFPMGEACTAKAPQDRLDMRAPCRLVQSMDLVPRSGLAHWNFWEVPAELLDDPEAFGRAYGAHFSKDLTLAEAAELVRPAVAQGIDEVHDHGLPYLAKRVAFGSCR